MTMLGLSSGEARARLKTFGANALPHEVQRSLISLTFSVLREPMLILLALAGALSFLLADLADAILLGATVIIVLGISIYQRQRTEKAIQALQNLTAPLALVMRDGRKVRIPSPEVVPGDILVLLEGDRVAADVRLLSNNSLEFDESLLTGESLPVTKSKNEMAFTGSLIVRGTGEAEVLQTGISTELGKIGRSIEQIPYQRTRLQASIDRLVKVIGILALFTVITIVVVYGLTRGDWLEGSLAAIASAMALIPEEFPVILTLFMALGAWRLARVKVIARQPAAIEALGSMTTLCVDKTGTLTRNEMVIDEFHLDGRHFITGSDPLPEEFHDLVRIGALATPNTPFDAMDLAFRESAKSLTDSSPLKSVEEIPLTRERLAYIHIWAMGDDLIAAAKGAPEHIGRLCRLSDQELEKLSSRVHKAAERGYRVIAIARGAGTMTSYPISLENFDFELLGIALLHDPIRDGVPEAVKECYTAGIRTVMITGDHPTTALAIAKDIGLSHSGRCIVGRELSIMNDDDLREAIKNCSVFARVSPDHKLRLIRALQSNGEVVGMTGDGVNDAPALRAADIGIAMGGRGTDVAREAAHLVITDDDFTSIVAGIRRGRAIFANIQKAMSYVVAIHIPIFAMALLPVLISDWPLILLPALVAFHEVIIDPACSIVFEVEEPDPEIMRKQPRSTLLGIFSPADISLALAQGIGVFLSVLTVFIYSQSRGDLESVSRSLTFAALLIANILLILSNRSKSLTIYASLRKRANKAVPWIVIGATTLLLLLLNIPWLREAFDLGPIRALDYLLLTLIAYLGVSWLDLYKFITKRRSGL